MEAWLYWFDLLGVAVFAASGALVASRKRMDLIGFGLMASLTGVGGGTLRDLLLGRSVFWVVDASYIHVCLVIAAALFVPTLFVENDCAKQDQTNHSRNQNQPQDPKLDFLKQQPFHHWLHPCGDGCREQNDL